MEIKLLMTKLLIMWKLLCKFALQKVQSALNKLPNFKAPEHDLVIGHVLKILPSNAIVLLTFIFNVMNYNGTQIGKT